MIYGSMYIVEGLAQEKGTFNDLSAALLFLDRLFEVRNFPYNE